MTKENSVLIFRRHFLSKFPSILLLLVLVFFSIYLSMLWPWSVQEVSLSLLGKNINFLLPLFALPPTLLAGYILHALFDARYVIGTDFVRSVTGLLSLHKHDARLELHNIRGIEIDRSLFERIFNLGTLSISSALSAEGEVIFKGIYNPSHYRDIIIEGMKLVTTKDD